LTYGPSNGLPTCRSANAPGAGALRWVLVVIVSLACSRAGAGYGDVPVLAAPCQVTRRRVFLTTGSVFLPIGSQAARLSHCRKVSCIEQHPQSSGCRIESALLAHTGNQRSYPGRSVQVLGGASTWLRFFLNGIRRAPGQFWLASQPREKELQFRSRLNHEESQNLTV
jgi:hypothetical protein